MAVTTNPSSGIGEFKFTGACPPTVSSYPDGWSPGVQVERDASVHESVLMPGARVGKGARLLRAVVDEGVEIPTGFCAGFDLEWDRKRHTVTNSGIVVISRSPVRSEVTTFAPGNADFRGWANGQADRARMRA